MVQHSFVRQVWKVYVMICLFSLSLQSSAVAGENMLDFSDGVIGTGEPGKLEQKAMVVLQEEIGKRTGIGLQVTQQWPDGDKTVIAVGLQVPTCRT
ncbi:MAG: hypothetical protein ACYS21_03915 [Planctomycetota bacterium]|jgi:hypothetical protein